MKKWIAGVCTLLILLSITGCGQENTRDVPELLEPVGVQLDVAPVVKEDIRSTTVYDGHIVPTVEQLQFRSDGKVVQVYVQLGDEVTEGQVLAELDESQLLRQIETAGEELEQMRTLADFADRQAEADIAIAQVQLEKLRAEGASEKVCALQELELKELQLKQRQTVELRRLEMEEKEKKLAALQENAGKNLLVAPCDGRVVFSSIVKNSSVKGYTTVMAVADESKLYLQMDYVSEVVLSGYEWIYAKIGDKEYEITYLPYSQEEFLSMTLSGEKMKTRFSLNAPAGELESGMYVAVMALDQCREAVLTVPVNALYYDSEGTYVYKIVDGSRVRCDVKVGVVTATKAEIISGLEEGEAVYVKG